MIISILFACSILAVCLLAWIFRRRLAKYRTQQGNDEHRLSRGPDRLVAGDGDSA